MATRRAALADNAVTIRLQLPVAFEPMLERTVEWGAVPRVGDYVEPEDGWLGHRVVSVIFLARGEVVVRLDHVTQLSPEDGEALRAAGWGPIR